MIDSMLIGGVMEDAERVGAAEFAADDAKETASADGAEWPASTPFGPLPRALQLVDDEREVAGLNFPPEEPDPTLDGRLGGG